jgi:hypothetical protein
MVGDCLARAALARWHLTQPMGVQKSQKVQPSKVKKFNLQPSTIS